MEEPKGGTYDALVLIQHLIILAQTNQKDQGGDVLETMNPLFPLTPLTTDIEQLVGQLADLECCLCDTCCLDTRTEDILVCGEVSGGSHTIDSVEVIYGRVVELEFA